MKRSFFIIPTALLVLTGCSSGSSAPTADPTGAAVPQESAAAAITAGFGSQLDLGNGITVTLDEPTAFTPGKFASNWVKGQTANKFNVTIKNGGATELDPSTVLITALAGNKNCVDVLDGDSNINGQPSEAIAAGSQISFLYGVACDAKAGEPLNLSVAINDKLLSVNGKLK